MKPDWEIREPLRVMMVREVVLLMAIRGPIEGQLLILKEAEPFVYI